MQYSDIVGLLDGCRRLQGMDGCACQGRSQLPSIATTEELDWLRATMHGFKEHHHRVGRLPGSGSQQIVTVPKHPGVMGRGFGGLFWGTSQHTS